MDLRIGQIDGTAPIRSSNNVSSKNQADFTEALLKGFGIKLSKHAEERLRTREIALDQEKIAKIAQGIQELDKKGVKEGVVILKDLAVVVGVNSKTIVTFKTPPFNKGGVFNQIDGAAIME
jgi:flagellar operon protein